LFDIAGFDDEECKEMSPVSNPIIEEKSNECSPYFEEPLEMSFDSLNLRRK